MKKSIESDSARLSYVDRPGDGPALLLIPGSFEDVHQWDALIEALPTDLRLILVEVRGHGESWPPMVGATIEQFGRDVAHVADHEGLQRFYVGGHSIGGMIALEVGRCIPYRIAGVISIEGWTHGQVTIDAFGGNMYGPLTPEQEHERLHGRERAAGHWSQEQRDAFAQIYLRWEQGESFLQSTELPVLELYGDRGRAKPSREQLRIPDRSNITLHFFDGASHALPLDRPREMAPVIEQFIRSHES